SFEWWADLASPIPRFLGTSRIQQATLPLGTHTVSLKVIDWLGGIDTADLTTRISDTVPPTLTVSATPAIVWPPDRRMAPVRLTIASSDACDSAPRVELIAVGSSEGNAVASLDIQGADLGAADEE